MKECGGWTGEAHATSPEGSDGKKKTVFVDMTRRAPSPFRESDKQAGGADPAGEKGSERKKERKKKVSGEERDEGGQGSRSRTRKEPREGSLRGSLENLQGQGGALSGRCEVQGRGGLWFGGRCCCCWSLRPASQPARSRLRTLVGCAAHRRNRRGT